MNWGVERHLDAHRHEVGKQNTQKNRKQALKFEDTN